MHRLVFPLGHGVYLSTASLAESSIRNAALNIRSVVLCCGRCLRRSSSSSKESCGPAPSPTPPQGQSTPIAPLAKAAELLPVASSTEEVRCFTVFAMDEPEADLQCFFEPVVTFIEEKYVRFLYTERKGSPFWFFVY